MATNLFTSQTPGIANVFENQNVTVGTTFYVTSADSCTGGRFYAPSTVGSGTFELVLYQITADDNPAASGTGTQLAASGTVSAASMTPSAWNTFTFSSPVSLSTGIGYRIGIRTSEGRYAATGGFFNSSGLTNSNITAPQTGTNPAAVNIGNLDNGSFIESIAAYPNKTFNGNCYFVDPTLAGASTTPFTKDLDIRWRVLNAITKDVDIRWRVLNAFTKDSNILWRVLNAFTSDVDVRWRVLNSITKDVDLRWRVLNTFASDTDLRWRVLGSFTKDVDLRWRVLNALTNDLDIQWRVFNTFNSDVDLRWRVLNPWTRDVVVQWRVLNSIASDVDLRWRVLNPFAKDVQILWDVLAANAFTKDLDLRWRVLNHLNKDLDIRWNVQSGALNVTLWNGTTEEPLILVGVWDGTQIVPVTLDIVL